MEIRLLFAKMASPKPRRTKRTSRRQQGLEPLVEETQGVVGSAETGSPSWGTLASLREASTAYLWRCHIQTVSCNHPRYFPVSCHVFHLLFVLPVDHLNNRKTKKHESFHFFLACALSGYIFVNPLYFVCY